ncbi:hypothetical protein [Streptomyces dangxiongensis]|uniref:hypothetical protein n=1 Tax=Streptomyces dangxiongensis TaxID=1442032 RepID=UPI0013CE6E29|nr:hypothetical protein [Streptomyces dangxiongensis]
MDYTKGAKGQAVQCLHCGTEIPQVPGVGRVRRYCRPSHGLAWRTRMRSAGWL